MVHQGPFPSGFTLALAGDSVRTSQLTDLRPAASSRVIRGSPLGHGAGQLVHGEWWLRMLFHLSVSA